eukprot:scaffold22615_cov133-Isochrysis_galbana.AAC.3
MVEGGGGCGVKTVLLPPRRGARLNKDRPITDTDVQSDGRPLSLLSRYPEIRMARFLYAMQWLPRDLRADYQLRQQWMIDNNNNMSYTSTRSLSRSSRTRTAIT